MSREPSPVAVTRSRRVSASLATVLAAAAFLVGLLAGTQLTLSDPGPSCPTEDSCQPTYDDGRWVIVPIVP